MLRDFLSAKRWMAQVQYEKWRTLRRQYPSEYTRGRLYYAKSCLAVCNQLVRDSADPNHTIAKYRRHLEGKDQQP